MLLHGWPGFWYDWRRLLPPLAGEADAIAPDFLGFGDSDRPDLPPEQFATEGHHAEDVLTLLDQLGVERFVAAGHDIGAAVAQSLTRRVPERVAALALFNPSYRGSTTAATRRRRSGSSGTGTCTTWTGRTV